MVDRFISGVKKETCIIGKLLKKGWRGYSLTFLIPGIGLALVVVYIYRDYNLQKKKK